jgi:hypothetical protein
MNVAFQRNVGSFIKPVAGLAAQTVTAGGGADGVAQNGITFNRATLGDTVLSALFSLHAELALGASDTATVLITFQDSADGSTWATYDAGPPDDYAAEVTAVNADGHHIFTRKCQLGGAKQYVRAVVTVTLSAAATDTAKIDGQFIVGGSYELPISEA